MLADSYVKVTDLDPTVCGVPIVYDADKEFAGKKVVIVSVPGAFTPTCQANHLPPYIKNIDNLHAKGVDVVAIIATNDAWVMNAWAKVNKVDRDDIVSSLFHAHRQTDWFLTAFFHVGISS
jgi:alkyl hydroperoxide reductase 1